MENRFIHSINKHVLISLHEWNVVLGAGNEETMNISHWKEDQAFQVQRQQQGHWAC